MGLIDDIRRALGPKCTQSVKFDAASVSVQGVEVKAGFVAVNVGGVNVSTVKLRDVSEAAAALDQLQFNWCQSESDPNLSSQDRHALAERRVAAVGMITGLRFALIALEANPSSGDLQAKVSSWLQAVQTFLTPPGQTQPVQVSKGPTAMVRTEGYSGGTAATKLAQVRETRPASPLLMTTGARLEPSHADVLKLWSHLGLESEDLSKLAHQIPRAGQKKPR